MIENIPTNNNLRLSEFRRDIFPSSIILSKKDLVELSEIINSINQKALALEIKATDGLSTEQKRWIRDAMTVEQMFKAENGDSNISTGLLEDQDFIDNPVSFFISNSTRAKRAINQSPLNTVEIFLELNAPSLSLDFANAPSNPTDSKSVVNIIGRDEDWVRASADRINEFFEKKKANRQIIHKAGIYDIFLYVLYIPIVLGLFYKYDIHISSWLTEKSIFFNYLFAVYIFIISLILARILFHIVRWLCPPIEYSDSNRKIMGVLRWGGALVLFSVFGAAMYDLIRFIIL